MYRIRQQDLPFKGSSHHFVGADNGDVNVSYFSSMPSRAPGQDRIDTPTTKCSSCARDGVSGRSTARSSRARPETSSFIKAGEVHEFKNTGDGPLVQVDVHLSPRFIQENL